MRRSSVLRRKQPAVDAATEDGNISQSQRAQPAAQFGAGHQGADRTAMKIAQIAEDEETQPAGVIIFAVAVEIGVKTAEHRDSQTARDGHGRPAQRALGRDINDIRALPMPATAQHGAGRQADVQAAIARQRYAWNQNELRIVGIIDVIRSALARANQ
jgi:hypothetical protein